MIERLRPEVLEFMRASEAILSIEMLGGADLSDEERGAVLLYIEDLTNKLTGRKTGHSDGEVQADGQDIGSTHQLNNFNDPARS